MSHIENYKKFKANVEQTQRWSDMLGKQFYDGGGVGRIDDVQLAKCKLYCRFASYEPEYHNAPQHFTKYLQQAIISQFDKLLEEAKQLEAEEFKLLAQKAHEEAKQIAEDAGLI